DHALCDTLLFLASLNHQILLRPHAAASPFRAGLLAATAVTTVTVERATWQAKVLAHIRVNSFGYLLRFDGWSANFVAAAVAAMAPDEHDVVRGGADSGNHQHADCHHGESRGVEHPSHLMHLLLGMNSRATSRLIVCPQSPSPRSTGARGALYIR